MTTVRDIIKRDIGVKVEGVVKVFDRAALATEIREYVVTDKIRKNSSASSTPSPRSARRCVAAARRATSWVRG
jgi:hypothetical protein